MWEAAQQQRSRARTTAVEAAAGSDGRFFTVKQLEDTMGKKDAATYIESVSTLEPAHDWRRYNPYSKSWRYHYIEDFSHRAKKDAFEITETDTVPPAAPPSLPAIEGPLGRPLALSDLHSDPPMHEDKKRKQTSAHANSTSSVCLQFPSSALLMHVSGGAGSPCARIRVQQ